jgi:hypothetical protein
MPSKATIYRTVAKFRATRSVLEKKNPERICSNGRRRSIRSKSEQVVASLESSMWNVKKYIPRWNKIVTTLHIDSYALACASRLWRKGSMLQVLSWISV